MIEVISSGESHGKGLIGIIKGIPQGLKVDETFINEMLSLRQKGYGRGKRMQIEKDKINGKNTCLDSNDLWGRCFEPVPRSCFVCKYKDGLCLSQHQYFYRFVNTGFGYENQ